jgi:hypothetical protein
MVLEAVDTSNLYRCFGKYDVHKLAAYIAKYCTKEMECRTLDEKRYFCSRGIPGPEVIYWRLHSDTMLVAVAVAREGNLDGMQWWCNNALGCVWVATAPGRRSDSRQVPF